MIKKGKHQIKSHMKLEYSFAGLRLQEGTLTPVEWTLLVDLVATGKKGKSRDEIENDANITYQRIYFWLETNLPNIIAVDVRNEDDLYIANLTTNIMMYCPDIPADDVLIQLLHAKISTLANPDLIVGEMHLKGSDTVLHHVFDCPDGAYSLPNTTKEYYTDGETRDKDPWWFRKDGFCFEFVKPDENSQSDEELFSSIVDPMDEFNRIVTELADTSLNLMKEPAKIVQVEKWKPRKVD
jgi:hypothetical protein